MIDSDYDDSDGDGDDDSDYGDDGKTVMIQATAQYTYRPQPFHGAYLPLDAGQNVTILAPPFWVWRDSDLLMGTYMVAVSTFTATNTTPTITDSTGNDNAPQPNLTLHTTNEPAQMALLGLAPLAAFFLKQND